MLRCTLIRYIKSPSFPSTCTVVIRSQGVSIPLFYFSALKPRTNIGTFKNNTVIEFAGSSYTALVKFKFMVTYCLSIHRNIFFDISKTVMHYPFLGIWLQSISPKTPDNASLSLQWRFWPRNVLYYKWILYICAL